MYNKVYLPIKIRCTLPLSNKLCNIQIHVQFLFCSDHFSLSWISTDNSPFGLLNMNSDE